MRQKKITCNSVNGNYQFKFSQTIWYFRFK